MDISIFQQIVGKLPLGICVLDRDLRIQYWNDFFASRLNFCQDVRRLNAPNDKVVDQLIELEPYFIR